jgi:muramidase (phage lysozyme)
LDYLTEQGANMARTKNLDTNIAAFLDMIAVSEIGLKLLHESDDGYNVIVGGKLFNDYSQHPNVLVDLPKLGIKSTAAGRYQVLRRYAIAYKASLRLPDFGPESQDAIALQMIREQRAMPDVLAGRFEAAVSKCRNIWASLPGAGYGQHENKLDALRAAYVEAGGVLA